MKIDKRNPALAIILRSRLRFAVLPIALLALFLGQQLFDPGIPTWVNATQAVVQPIAVCGPLLAAFAAWDATDFGRVAARKRMRLSRNGGAAAIASVWLGSASWAVLSFALWATLLLVSQVNNQPWGTITWPWLVSATCALLAQVSAGAVLGYFWPTFLAPAVAAVVLFFINGAVVLIPVLHNQTLLSAAFSQVQQVAFTINLPILWAQALWFTGIAIIGLAIALGSLSAPTKTKINVLLTGTTAAAAGLALIVTSPGGFFEYTHSGWDYVCSKITKICVHPALEKAIPQIDDALEPTLAHIERTNFSASRYEWTNRGLLGEPSSGAIAFHLDSLSPGWKQNLRLELSRDLLTAGSSSGGPCDKVNGDADPGAVAGLKSIIAAWLADAPEAAIPNGAQEIGAKSRFDKLSEIDRQSWLFAHTNAICTSTLNSDDF